MSERPEHVDSSARYLGRVLITVGVLIVLLAGSCTLFVLVIVGLDKLFLTAQFGGLPLLVGIYLIYSGRERLRRSAMKSNPPDDHA